MIEHQELQDADRRNLARRFRRDSGEGELASELALEAAGLGAWDIVPARGESHWSRRAKLLLGFAPEEHVTPDAFARALRAVDRARLMEACVRVIEPHGDPAFRLDVSVLGGSARWLRLTGAAYVDECAEVHVVGTIQDVTPEKLEELETSRDR